MSIIGVVVMAELIIVLTGGIDISVGSALGLAAVHLCWPVRRPQHLLVPDRRHRHRHGIIGAVNGWLVSFRGLEPFIVTLGMLALARGLVYAYGQGIPIQPEAGRSGSPRSARPPCIGIPVLALIWIGVVLDRRLPAQPHCVGPAGLRHRQQQGGGPQLGYPGARTTLWSVYILAGLLVGLGGWMFICPLRQRYGVGGQPAGAGGHRRGGDRWCPALRRLRQGVRRSRRHDHLPGDRQPAVAC